jgi:chemosensory pili system protein ChpA (sensor histidine kinase/response regulator)
MDPKHQATIDYLNETLGAIPTPKILVVEDDPNDLELHLHALRKFDCEIVTAKNGADAIREIQEDGIDLVLLDYMLPCTDPNSSAVVEAATGLMPNAKVVMVTGYPDSDTKSTAVKKGVALILPKPLTEETLSAILHKKPAGPPLPP